MEGINREKNLTVFGEILDLILEQILLPNSNASEKVKIASRRLKEVLSNQLDFKDNDNRNGIQANIGNFLKVVSDDLFLVADIFDKKYHDTWFNAFSTYLFNSPLLIESKGGYKTFDLKDIIPFNEDYSKVKGKKNEIFASLLFTGGKKPNVYRICQLVTLLTIFLLRYNISLEEIFYHCVGLLRKQDFTFFCDSKIIKEKAQVQWENCDKSYVCENMYYNRNEVFALALKQQEKDSFVYACGQLMYLTIAWFDGNAKEEARKAINRWIDIIMGGQFKENLSYWKYLWIRYRRLPNDLLTPSEHSLYTIDNIYVLPTILDNNGREIKHPLSDFFSANNHCSVFASEVGKSAFIDAIIASLVMNCSYAAYRGGKELGVSSYYTSKYKKLREDIFLDAQIKKDVVPLIINGDLFEEYLSKSKEANLIDFAYYIIQSYDSQLNLKGERNQGWYNKWKQTFYLETFKNLIEGASEDERLLLIVDGYDQMAIRYQKRFNSLIKEFLNKYGSQSDIIITCYKKENVINNLDRECKIYSIANFNKPQIEELIKNYCFSLNQENSELISSLINAYENDNGIEIKQLEAKVKHLKQAIDTNKIEPKKYNLLIENPLFVTSILSKRLKENKDFLGDILAIEELDDLTYVKLYVSATSQGYNLFDYLTNHFKIAIFNLMSEIIDGREIDRALQKIFDCHPYLNFNNPYLNSSSKMVYKISYNNDTALKIKEYIDFLSRNLG